MKINKITFDKQFPHVQGPFALGLQFTGFKKFYIARISQTNTYIIRQNMFMGTLYLATMVEVAILILI